MSKKSASSKKKRPTTTCETCGGKHTVPGVHCSPGAITFVQDMNGRRPSGVNTLLIERCDGCKRFASDGDAMRYVHLCVKSGKLIAPPPEGAEDTIGYPMRRCPRCRAPEVITESLGLKLSNLSPHTGICVACVGA